MAIHEITAIARLANDRAIVFGENWNATISGEPAYLDRLERQTPGVLVDVVAVAAPSVSPVACAHIPAPEDA